MKEVLFLQIGSQFAFFLSVYLSYVATYTWGCPPLQGCQQTTNTGGPFGQPQGVPQMWQPRDQIDGSLKVWLCPLALFMGVPLLCNLHQPQRKFHLLWTLLRQFLTLLPLQLNQLVQHSKDVLHLWCSIQLKLMNKLHPNRHQHLCHTPASTSPSWKKDWEQQWIKSWRQWLKLSKHHCQNQVKTNLWLLQWLSLAAPDSSTLPQPNSLGDTSVAPAGIPMVSMKAKPPTPPELIQPAQKIPRIISTVSNERERRRHSKDNKPSRSSIRRSTHRIRACSPRPHQGDHASTSRGSRHHHDTPSHRQEAPSRTSRIASTDGRDFSHPIFQRSNAMRKRSPAPIILNLKDSDKCTPTHTRPFMPGPRTATWNRPTSSSRKTSSTYYFAVKITLQT